MISKSELLFLFIGFSIAGLLFFFQSVCQDSTTGNLSAVPWFYPCPNGGTVQTSASTD